MQSANAQSEPSSARSSAVTLPRWNYVVLAALCLWLYASTLLHLVSQWWHDPNFSHGFFVPLFSAFLLWKEKDCLARIAPRPSWWGFALLAGAAGLLILGQMGAELFLARFSLLIVLAGFVVLFAGWSVFRAVIFPWAVLLLMIPFPAILFNHITFPLQLFASRVSAFVLDLLGVPTYCRGNIIEVPTMTLQVAEACSGIRSLTSLITLAIIYGYLLEKRAWVRIVLAVAAVPIAIAANCVRIVGTGLLVQYWSPEAAEGYFHSSWGWITFLLSLFMLYGVHAIIRTAWPDERESPDRGGAR